MLDGTCGDLANVPPAMAGVPAYHRCIHDITHRLPPAARLSCGGAAARLGAPHAARAVEQALGTSRLPTIVPRHRYLAAGGKVGGFPADGDAREKRR